MMDEQSWVEIASNNFVYPISLFPEMFPNLISYFPYFLSFVFILMRVDYQEVNNFKYSPLRYFRGLKTNLQGIV
jgi:hypothetical protein